MHFLDAILIEKFCRRVSRMVVVAAGFLDTFFERLTWWSALFKKSILRDFFNSKALL
jgi:hypothetical protein